MKTNTVFLIILYTSIFSKGEAEDKCGGRYYGGSLNIFCSNDFEQVVIAGSMNKAREFLNIGNGEPSYPYNMTVPKLPWMSGLPPQALPYQLKVPDEIPPECAMKPIRDLNNVTHDGMFCSPDGEVEWSILAGMHKGPSQRMWAYSEYDYLLHVTVGVVGSRYTYENMTLSATKRAHLQKLSDQSPNGVGLEIVEGEDNTCVLNDGAVIDQTESFVYLATPWTPEHTCETVRLSPYYLDSDCISMAAIVGEDSPILPLECKEYLESNGATRNKIHWPSFPFAFALIFSLLV